MSHVLALLLAVVSMGDAPKWSHFTLKSGVHLSVWQIAEARKQTTFTFLPLSLINDDAGRAQFAHLVEHMLIRSTDPDALQAGGIMFNGETGAVGLRLESFADVTDWQAAVLRHVRWLDASAFEAPVLEREKQNIAAEEQSTTKNGYTHKWAQAAWNQVVRHGRDHASVHGDVAGATVEQVRDYVRAKVTIGAGVRIVAVGPVAATEIKDLLDAKLAPRGAGPAHAAGTSATPGETSATAARKPGEHEASWDLPARHYLEWYAWPSDAPRKRAALYLVTTLLNMRLVRDPTLQSLGAHALASADLGIEGQHYLAVSVSVPEAADLEAVQKAVRVSAEQLLQTAPGEAGLATLIAQMAQELEHGPDVKAMRARAAGMQADLLEAQMALNLVQVELTTGLRMDELVAAVRELSADEVAKLVRANLTAAARSSLLLEPER